MTRGQTIRGCVDETIMVWDRSLRCVTESADDGSMEDTWSVTFEDDLPPYIDK